MAEAIVDIDKLANAITNAVAEAGPVKQIHISRYTAKTPWNPTGSKQRPKLAAKFLQNGHIVRPEFVNDEAIQLLNRLKPGRYIERLVEVMERKEGNEEREVEIRYSNKTVEQRMNLKNYFRNFNELLQQIVNEQEQKSKVGKGVSERTPV